MEDFERPYRETSPLRAIVRFIVFPAAFIEMAATHDVSWDLTENEYVRNQYFGDATQRLKLEQKARENAAFRTQTLRRSFFASWLLVLLSAGLGSLVGWLCGRYVVAAPAIAIVALQVAGGGILLWVTIWQLNPDVRTVGGDSLTERVHSWLYRGLYIIGTALFFVAYAWHG